MKVKWSKQDVIDFARITGDTNPIHFEGSHPILHGMLSGSVFSKYFGTTYPNCIYISQTLNFHAPMYVDVEYTVKFLTLSTNKGIIEVYTEILDDNVRTLSGIARVKLNVDRKTD